VFQRQGSESGGSDGVDAGMRVGWLGGADCALLGELGLERLDPRGLLGIGHDDLFDDSLRLRRGRRRLLRRRSGARLIR
jgi:hypothetical protein